MATLVKFVKEKYLLIGVSFLLFFIPAYPKFPLFGVSGTYIHVRLEDFFVALIFGFFGLSLLIKKDYTLLKESLTKLFLLYFGLGLLSIISAIFITKNIVPHIAFLHFFRRLEYVSLLYVTYFSFRNLKQLKIYGWIILVTTFLVIFYGLGQKFFGWPVVSTMNKEFSRGMILKLTWWARINSTFAGHYDLAAFMVMIIPLTAAALMIAKKWLIRIPLIFLWLCSYYVLLLTASRVSFGAYLVSVTLVFLLSKKYWLIIPVLAISLLGMFFSEDLGQRYAATFKLDLSFLSGKIQINLPSKPTVLPTASPTPVPIAVVPTLPPKKKTLIPTPTLTLTLMPEPIATGSSEPIESTALAVGRSTDIRLKVEWPRALRAFAKNPLLGTGYSSIDIATDNDYLRMLGEIGLLGTLAFFAVMAEIGRRIFYFIKSDKSERNAKLVVMGIVGSAFGYFLNATFIDVFESSKIAFFFWILMGVALKVIDLSKSNEK